MRERVLEQGPVLRRGLLIAIAVGVPILFLRVTNDPFGVPKLALLLAGVALVATVKIAELLQGATPSGLKRLALPAAVFSLPLIVSWAASPYRSWATFGQYGRLQGLIPYLAVVAFGVLAADAFGGRSRSLAMAMLWAGAIVGGYAIVQTIGIDPFSWSLYGAPTEAVSTTGNPNFTGGFLAIVIPVGIGLAIADRDRRRLALRLLAVTAAGWLAARSQGGWAAGVAGAGIVVGHSLSARRPWARWAGYLLAAAMAAFVVGSVLFALAFPDSRFASSSLIVRGRWWSAALGMAADSPVIGRGPNTFSIEGVRHRTLDDAIEFGYDFPDDPHSVPMALISGAGIVGGLGFVALLAWTLWSRRSAPPDSLLGAGFLGGVVAYFVQSLVSIDELSLRIGLWASLAGLSASGVVLSAHRQARSTARAEKTRSRFRRPRASVRTPLRGPVAVALVALLALTACVWSASFVLADARAQHARTLLRQGKVGSAQKELERAIGFRDETHYRVLLAFALKPLVLDAEPPRPGLLEEADRAFSYTAETPFVFSIVSHARVLSQAETATTEDRERAASLFIHATELDPLNPLIRAEGAELLLELERSEEALALVAPMTDTVGDRYPLFWGVVALARARQGDFIGAEEAVGIALALDQVNPLALQAQRVIERGGP